MSPQPRLVKIGRLLGRQGAKAFGRFFAFAAVLYGDAPIRACLALLFLLLANLSEGFSIALLVPLLSLMVPGTTTVSVPFPSWVPLIGHQTVQLSLVPVLLFVVVAATLRALFDRFRSIHSAELLYDVVSHRRLVLFESIGRARWSYIATLRGSDIQHAVNADVDRLQVAAFYLIMLVQDVTMLVIYVAMSFLISSTMALFAFATGAVLLMVLRPVRRRAAHYGELLTQNRQDQYRTVSEFIAGLKVAKSLNVEPQYLAALTQTLSLMRKDFSSYLSVSTFGGAFFQITSVVVICVFAYVGVSILALPFPQLAVLMLLFWRMVPRFSAVHTDMQELLVNLPAFDAVEDLRRRCEQERETDEDPSRNAPRIRTAVQLQSVEFMHPGAESASLRGVDLDIPAGQVTALIGPSGSGKSTLADIVMGLLEPTKGRLSIDGRTLSPSERRPWRDTIAYVPQDVFLLNDTLRANLVLGARAAVDDAAIWSALSRASAASFVSGLPLGLETKVGDRGLRLSGGERQRIALARALLRQPQLLILDEATSALDWESQSFVAQTIGQLRQDMTILTIAHRVSMIAFADHVVALDEGKVVEAGSFDDLRRDPNSRLARMMAAEGGAEGNASGSAHESGIRPL